MLDVQLKRGLLDVCVLRCIADGDSYGYQIIRQLEGCVTISESTLYPILKRRSRNIPAEKETAA